MSDGVQSHRGHASIFAIKLSNKVCRPKVPNTYVPVNYSDNIENEVFDYVNDGKTVFRTKEKWAERDRSDIINFDHTKDNEELSKGLKIDKYVEIQSTRTIRSLVVK